MGRRLPLQKFFTALKQFSHNTRGGIAPIFALVFLGCMIVVGFTIDFRRMQNAQTHIQNAADSAVLAATRSYLISAEKDESKKRAAVQKVASDYLKANLSATGEKFENASIVLTFKEDGEIEGTVTSKIDLYFSGLLGKQKQEIPAFSAAKAGDSRRIEVVLVLDNSGSMFYGSRMIQLRSAAVNFVNDLFDNAVKPGSVQIGVVPWNLTVNINMERPGSWDSSAGAAANSHSVGSRTPPNAGFQTMTPYLFPPGYSYAGTYTTAAMQEDFGPVDWRGCIMASPNERLVNGNGEVTSKLTETPPSPMKWPVRWVAPEIPITTYVAPGKASKKNGNGCENPSLSAARGDVCHIASYIKPQNKQCREDGCKVFDCEVDDTQYGNNVRRNAWIPHSIACLANNAKNLNKTLAPCVSDPHEYKYLEDTGKNGDCNWWPYDNFIPKWDNETRGTGPNIMCPTAMLGMSQSRPQIIEKLNHMYPTGNTHADIGLMWGFRMMSSRSDWASFFGYTADTRPEAFNSHKARKMMIMLTDGQNTTPGDFEGYYGCTETQFWHWESGRGWVGNCQYSKGLNKLNNTVLDNLMIDSCKTIRENGVELYTIALDLNEKDYAQSNAIKLLKQCAAVDDRFYNIKGSELGETFKGLAAKALRLSQ